ncbi:Hydroxyisourate hydrolase [Artomyces pyxidatus]|uniref:Hydroxyisourate hydrolase n=1 Tax=Artomyces pyxidatus TaxID=48021 RepID=A0ACB8TIC2_9AGAM|nr:Hydroxyisourate hydrolase [Artomyces pyxidatus]
MSRSPITCHVLDSSLGKPVAGVEVRLQQCHPPAFDGGPEIWEPLAKGTTNSDGRCVDLLSPRGDNDAGNRTPLKAGGLYKIVFKTKEYFQETERLSFYPWVEIPFEVANPDEHYHIPLLISPYSYTTYRGS